MALRPVYTPIRGMSDDYLTSHIQAALDNPACTQETCSYSIIQNEGLMDMPLALKELHKPSSQEKLDAALYRMRFDELLYFALRMELSRRDLCASSPFIMPRDEVYQRLLSSLPFSLTSGQQEAVNDMIDHIRSGHRLNALLQADVGAGKTICCFLMMALAVSNGYQAALMAPTTQLASQHYEDMQKLFSPLGVTVGFVGEPGMRAAAKRKLNKEIADGKIQLVVGTHSLLSSEFNNLALCVIDEEHKFGVMQRKALVSKAAGGVHCLTMSASPIPRSLAQTIYDDSVQVYTITTMPAGRKPVITVAINDENRLLNMIRFQRSRNQQTYVVCPAIEKSDKEAMANVNSVEDTFRWITSNLASEGIIAEMLTGDTPKADAEEIIRRFRANDTHVLIATTIIEVGINIPTATAILVMNSERFGLASLHQLRGRVCRGTDQGYCVLQGATFGNPRIEAMLSTTNGFEIAEADLKIRGPGDFLGTQQSGDNKYVSLMLAYPDTYNLVKEIAKRTIEQGLSYPLFSKAKEDFAALEDG